MGPSRFQFGSMFGKPACPVRKIEGVGGTSLTIAPLESAGAAGPERTTREAPLSEESQP